MKLLFAVAIAGLLATGGAAFGQSAKANHLVISEMLMNSPGAESVGDINEYVEIYNPTDTAIDLSDYFLTDLNDENGPTQYWMLPSLVKADPSAKFGPEIIPNGRHIFQFPDASSIPSGGVVVVTWVADRFLGDFFGNDLAAFKAQMTPEPQLFETLPSARGEGQEVPEMITYRAPAAGSEGEEYSLSKANGGDMIVLFMWDGISDLVTDIDMVTYSGHSGPLTKSGAAIDGPDADETAQAYQAEPTDFSNLDMKLFRYPDPDALYRVSLLEPGESPTGGNGLNGHSEVTEITVSSFKGNEPAQTVPPLTPGTTELTLASSDYAATPYAGSRQVANPGPGTAVPILANVADDALSPVVVSVKYFVNGGPVQSVVMTPTANPEEYTADLGPFATNKTEVTWYVEATDAAGSAVYPAGSDVDPALQKIFLVDSDPVDGNEIMINEIYYDFFGSGEEGEYLEFFNNTAIDQPMGGFVLRDTAGNLGIIPAGAVIPASGYLVITNSIDGINAKLSEPVNNIFQTVTGYNNGGDGFHLIHVNEFSLNGAAGTPIDSVVITHPTTENPDPTGWPTDGNNAPAPKTTELISPNLGETVDNSLPANWAASVPDFGTPGKLNSTKWPADVSDWNLY